MQLARFLNKLFQKDGFILIDAYSKKYIIGLPKNKMLCDVRNTFEKFNLISGLHSFMSNEDGIYKNVLPPVSLLNEKDKLQLIEELNKLNFTLKSLKVA